MMRPDEKEFLRLARHATLVPVSKSVSADLQTPVSAFLSLAADEPHAFLLESIEGGEKIARYTFLGARPSVILSSSGGQVTIEYPGKKRKPEVVSDETQPGRPPIFDALRKLLRQHTPAKIDGLPPFTGGAVGYVSYDVVRQLENIGEHAKDELKVPDAVFMFFDRLLAFDHLRHEIHIIAVADVRDNPKRAWQEAQRDIAAIEKKLAAGVPAKYLKASKPRPGKLDMRASMSPKQFQDAVRKAKEYIAAGDIFQVVPSLRLSFTPETEPLAIYRALRRVNPSPYMYFLKMGGMHVLGSSPEMLVRVTGRKIEYRPIAGTSPRGKDDAEDQRIEQHLRNDEKERAEHVMLVDLGRNDVGRVAEYGSVRVANLMYVERYSHVMHLVSAVEGTLREELDAFDALAACFPAGTLSGAPKVRAMQIIEELEPVRRGIYGGSVLYADYAGNLDSCIVIRTMLTTPKNANGEQAFRATRDPGANIRAHVQVGAGIVADSDPEREYQECMNKARALVRASEMARGVE
jgi:anthranilate synthase component 1